MKPIHFNWLKYPQISRMVWLLQISEIQYLITESEFLISMINSILQLAIFCNDSFSNIQTRLFKRLPHKPYYIIKDDCAVNGSQLDAARNFPNVLYFNLADSSWLFIHHKIAKNNRLSFIHSVITFEQPVANPSNLLPGKIRALFQVYFGST